MDMNSLYDISSSQLTTLAQIEISPWQLAPGLIMLAIGATKILQTAMINRRKRHKGYKNAQRSERKKVALPITINTPVTHEFSLNTFDISLTGAFLAYEDLKNSMSFTSLIGKRSGIKTGDLVDITVQVGRFSRLSCQAKVIRYNFSDNTMPPKGIGIEFMNLNPKNKKILESILYSEQFTKAS